MKPSYASALGIGAVIGLILAAAALLFVGATGGIPKLDVTGEGASIEPVFAVPASAMWVVSITAGIVTGLILAIMTKAIARVIDPSTGGAALWIIASLGAVVGGTVVFAIFPLGMTLMGSLQDGVVTVSIADTALLTAIAGLSGGAVICWQSYIMARPPSPSEDQELLTAP